MNSASIRRPAVAGRFYPSDPDDLRAEVREYLSETIEDEHPPERALGCMVPHAGYRYSGHVAGPVFAHVQIPQRCVLLCPNHTGVGHPLAIMSEGAWKTPLGDVPIDSEIAHALKERFPALEEDPSAHRAEHAAEVELPFMQMRQGEFRFVPIALGTRRFEILEELGKALADVIAKQKDPVLTLASSDMNHYENDVVTRTKDHQAIEKILTLDPRGLFDVVTQQDISMCGFGPAIVMLTAARQLGARSAKLVKYATSGDVSGDRDMVVGYAGIVVL